MWFMVCCSFCVRGRWSFLSSLSCLEIFLCVLPLLGHGLGLGLGHGHGLGHGLGLGLGLCVCLCFCN